MSSRSHQGASLSGSVRSFDVSEVHDDDHVSNEERQIYLSVVWFKSQLGAAYYDLTTGYLFALPDVHEIDDFQMLSKLLQVIGNCTLITPLKKDNRMANFLNHHPSTSLGSSYDDTSESADGSNSVNQQFLGNHEFGYERAKSLICQTQVLGMPQDVTDETRFEYWSSTLPMDSIQMVRALGGLLRYLVSNNVGVMTFDGAEGRHQQRTSCLNIVSIQLFSIPSVVLIEPSTFIGLQIFRRIEHPSGFKKGLMSKEGFSLFNLVSQGCVTNLGNQLLQLWFRRPLIDSQSLQSRYNTVELFSKPSNQSLMRNLHDFLPHVKNVLKILLKMSQTNITMQEWKRLAETIQNLLQICNVIKAAPEKDVLLETISSIDVDTLIEAVQLIDQILDFETHKDVGQKRALCVRYGLDAELDKKKDDYENLAIMLNDVVASEAQVYPEIDEMAMIYMPQVGFLLVVPVKEATSKILREEVVNSTFNPSFSVNTTNSSEVAAFETDDLFDKELAKLDDSEENTLPSESNDTSTGFSKSAYKDWSVMFVADRKTHFKTPKCRELDAIYGDLLCDIQDRQTEIASNLQASVLACGREILCLLELSAQLDCFLALAKFAVNFNLTRPGILAEEEEQVSSDSSSFFQIVEGRHILQECCLPDAQSFVPNDSTSGLHVENGDDCAPQRVHVIQGPNASGKSIYIKQVGLIVYLAQIGSFVPAKRFTFKPVHSIFTKMTANNCVSSGLSTFAHDCNQISIAVRNASADSLILLDEFGKGTRCDDGSALLSALLKYWNSSPVCPHVLVATHLNPQAHLSDTLFAPQSRISFYRMDFAVSDMVDNDDASSIVSSSMISAPRRPQFVPSITTTTGSKSVYSSSSSSVSIEHGPRPVFLYKVVRVTEANQIANLQTRHRFAFHVARQMGFPTRVIERASVLLRHLVPAPVYTDESDSSSHNQTVPSSFSFFGVSPEKRLLPPPPPIRPVSDVASKIDMSRKIVETLIAFERSGKVAGNNAVESFTDDDVVFLKLQLDRIIKMTGFQR